MTARAGDRHDQECAGSDPGAVAAREPARPDLLGIEGLEDAREIGRGGFAVVYRARQPALDRLVAVKVLWTRFEATGNERFAREGYALGSLSGHPNIVNVYGTGNTADGRPYIAMDYLRRGTLANQIREHGPLDWTGAVRIGVKIAGALESAHRSSTLHRDVKPENILLSDYGEPLLADFGIARVGGMAETAGGNFVGSVLFTAPEVLEGRPPSPPADLYSLAATLYYVLTGVPPFPPQGGEPFASLYVRIVTRPAPELARDVPERLRTALRRALHKDPDRRQPSVAEFGAELQAVETEAGIPPTSMAVGPDLAPFRSGRPVAGRSPATPCGRRRCF